MIGRTPSRSVRAKAADAAGVAYICVHGIGGSANSRSRT